MTQVAKRARANTAGESHSIEASATPERNRQDLIKDIELLNQTELASIIVWAADKHDDVTRAVAVLARKAREKKREEEERQREEQKKRVISFDGLVDKVWELLTNTRGMSNRQEYNAASKVCIGIEGIIVSIELQCGEISSPGSRCNGLFALADIGECVAESPGRLGHEARKELGSNQKLVSALRHIVTTMSEYERRVARQDDQNPGVLWRRLKEFQRTARDYCIFDGFDSILEYFKIGPEESKDAENDGEEEGAGEGEGEVTAEDEWRAQVDQWMKYVKRGDADNPIPL